MLILLSPFFHFTVRNLIPPEVRSLVRHADNLLQYGCRKEFISLHFTEYSYALLSLGISIEDYDPCDYIGEIQQALGYTSSVDEDASFLDFVVLPEDLKMSLEEIFGSSGVPIDGQFLLGELSNLSARRLLTFIREFFTDNNSGGRRLRRNTPQSVSRGRVIQAVRGRDPEITQRALQGEAPAFSLAVNELLTISMDYNFGDGAKELLFGLAFGFQSDDSGKGTIQDLLESFLGDTVGDNVRMKENILCHVRAVLKLMHPCVSGKRKRRLRLLFFGGF